MLKQTVTFQDALEMVESLSDFQQDSLLDIIRHRLVARRQRYLAERIKEARREYSRGDVRKGSVADLMKELSE